jgi:hypothetical protein
MLQHTHTPLSGEDRIAGLLIELERAIAPTLTLTPLAVRRQNGTVEALVVARLHDGTRERLTPAEARTMAHCLKFDTDYTLSAVLWWNALMDAATAAERQATLVVCGQGSSHLVAVAH